MRQTVLRRIWLSIQQIRSRQIAAQNRLRYMNFFGDTPKLPAILAYHGQAYQHLFDWQRVRKEVRVVQPLFYVRKGSDLKIQAVWAKTCRGAMTRFIIENRIDKPKDFCAFSYEGFTYEPKLGEANFPHFVK